MSRNAWLTLFAASCLTGLVNCTTGDRLTPVSSTVEAITATSGTPQSHAIDGAFAVPLVVTVTKNGSPASGVAVTFTAPATGATGTFANTSANTTTATTDANGVAISAVFSANGTAGAYTVMASASGAQAAAAFSLSNTTGAPAAISAVSGTPQSSGISTSFAGLLGAKVVDSGQNPVGNAIVVFRAPASGASGTFADTGNNSTTAITNAAGVATAAAFTANGTPGADTVLATVSGVPTPATFNLTNSAGAVATITATSGTPQSTLISTAFASPLVATVLDGGSNPVSGVPVVFSAPTNSPSGTFSNGTATETDTTDANGKATSTVFTANGTAGGPYTVTATVAGAATAANFSLTNTSTVATSKTYVFYLSGEEPSLYSYGLAGAVQVDSSGNVLGGEQDYNDGAGIPSSDTITGGTLSTNSTTGQGTLTLITNNANRGVQGTETFGVQFANVNHALIVQFDGTATSSGSMDVQTLPATPSGGYAFTLAGLDPTQLPVAFGGVFAISGTTLNGSFDTNDDGVVTPNAALSGTLTAVDAFGRGTITTSSIYIAGGTPVLLNYYVVGPEVLRIIDVDFTDSAIGSAFGQGVNATSATNASLGSSVFGIMGNMTSPVTSTEFAAAGMFSTNASAATFSGFADDDELYNSVQALASPISGSYTIASNGYGSLTIPSGSFGSISVLGVYMTDPNLNLIDPNNTTGGLGGALAADMDQNPTLAGGIGILLPQTDTASSSFTGTYAFGGQDFNVLTTTGELDFVGTGTVTNLSLSGTGLISDPFLTLGAQPTNTGVQFSGTAVADTNNPGRYTMSPLQVTVGSNPPLGLSIYQASGGQLLWLNDDIGSVFLGSLQKVVASTTAEAISATSGTPQTALINTAFAAPLVATVTTGGSPNSGVVVTFTAPAIGAGGTFAGGSLTATATTNASGVATSPTFTANGAAGTYTVAATVIGVSAPANFSLTNTATAVEVITATSGTPQSAVINTAFAAPFVATVTTGGSPTSGVVVTFTAPSIGASGTFAGGSLTATATTNASGIATSPTFTANGTTGTYTVAASVAGLSTSATFSLTNTVVAVEVITATSGTPQSAVINTAFAAPFVATVTTGGSPTIGVVVTFTAPASGASGTFTGGSRTATATTNASGIATSPTFTANGTTGTYTVAATVVGVSAPANFNLTNTAAAVELITATSGTPQSATVNTAFALPLVATVTTGGSGTSGVVVTFTAPASGASGSFTGGSRTAMVTTDANGIATSPTFTANGTAGGPYTVTATVTGVATAANFSLTNTPVVVSSKTYVFYLSGEELSTFSYGLAGSVQIAANGSVIAGEQDYNDGAGIPSSDTITGGTLNVDPGTGQGTLTLITNNSNRGVQGTETLGVQFVNVNHALIVQFDGTATSSGSLDLQTLPATLSGGYAFTLAGLDSTQLPVALGGVFTISGTTLNGSLDTNDDGVVTPNAALSGTLTTVDAFGRGTITTNSIYSTPVSLNYYVVGPKVLRIIDVDVTDSAIGSAFGQGVNASGATNASLGSSVFGINGNMTSPVTSTEFAAAGMFSTNASAGTFSGVADDDEPFLSGQFPASAISGSYTIASNGYGSLTIPSGSFGSISVLGVYMTDPTLNLLDPNNTTRGLGGALTADMDANSGLAGGIGILLPQTDTSSSSFTGTYPFGGQDFNVSPTGEFDFVGLGTVTGTAPNQSFAGTGLVSDPFLTLGALPTNPGVPFSGNPVPDTNNPGRYTMSPLQVTIGINPALGVAIYQASGGQLLWLNNDANSIFLGSLQQQGSLAGLPAARRGKARISAKPKR